jgi:hypothetical protein
MALIIKMDWMVDILGVLFSMVNVPSLKGQYFDYDEIA